MMKASEFRQRARECRELAEKAKSAADRKVLLDMAEAWESLLEVREKTGLIKGSS
jgi:hypothetical protein